jgi:galactose mutarotase-like enzyme
MTEANNLRASRNTLSKQVGMLMGQAKKDPSKLEEAEAVKAQVKANAERLAYLEVLETELAEKIRKRGQSEGGTVDLDLIFSEKETLYAYALNGDILTDYTKLMLNNSNKLVLDDRFFALDAVVFKDVKSNSVTLQSRISDRRVRVDFDGFDYLVLWHKHTAPYLCIEPWCGLSDLAGSSFDFAEKAGMRALTPGSHFARTHVITVG